MTEYVNGRGSIVNGNMFVFPAGEQLNTDDLRGLIDANQSGHIHNHYKDNFNLYIGNHGILSRDKDGFGPDNKLVVNLAKYAVETFNGYFMGITPKITLDDQTDNQLLQKWNDTQSFQDKLNEISKQSDIYGRSIAFLYQNEDSETCVTYFAPTNAFVVYDDTVAHDPLCFVRYAYNESEEISGQVWYAKEFFNFSNGMALEESQVNVFGSVPAVEFFNNEERQGVFEPAKTLIEQLDEVLSQKANQNEYFDNAYLKILGIDLDTDGDGLPDIDLETNHLFYSPDIDSAKGIMEFITKPDNDSMQEHMLDRLVSLIYQTTMVANLNDEAFSGNSSGVALQYKLLPMKNMAASKERKFTQALRKLYRIAFGVGTILSDNKADAWQDLSFQFTRNLPVNVADEAQTASALEGVVSKETQLSTLSFVDDPQSEIKKMADESEEKMKSALNNTVSGTDANIDGNVGGVDVE